MSWFGGFVARDDGCSVRIPSDARLLRDGNIGVWIVEDAPAENVRIIANSDLLVVVFGICAADDDDILDSLASDLKQDAIWPGSYTLAVCDGRSISVSTDIANTRPIYTANIDSCAVWGSSSRQLAIVTQSQVDLHWLATGLLTPGVEPAITLRSAFAGISMVPAGRWLTIDSSDKSIDRYSAWKPTRRTSIEASTKLAEELSAGINARVGSSEKVTADCSGGLDSTTLTLLAFNQIGAPDRLAAITLHPRGVIRGGDFDYVNQVLIAQPKLKHHWIGLDDSHLPFAEMDKVPASDEPAPMTAAYARMLEQFHFLSNVGSGVHLTGDGGDTLLCPPLLYLADLMASGRYIKSYRHAIGWARVRQVSPWPLLRDAFISTRCDYAESIASLALSLQQRTNSLAIIDKLDAPSASWHDLTTGPWITELAYQNASQMLQMAAASYAQPTDLDRAGQITLTALRTVGRTARADIQLAASHGIALDNPYLDSSVVDTVLSVPAREWSSPDKFKPLLTQAFPALLPKAIRGRTTKGSFEIDHYRGAHVHSALLHDLADGELATLGLVNPAPLHDALNLAAVGLPVDIIGIERVLATEAWLRAVKTTPSVPWRAHQPIENRDVSVSSLS